MRTKLSPEGTSLTQINTPAASMNLTIYLYVKSVTPYTGSVCNAFYRHTQFQAVECYITKREKDNIGLISWTISKLDVTEDNPLLPQHFLADAHRNLFHMYNSIPPTVLTAVFPSEQDAK